MLLFLQPDLLAGRSELPAGRVVRASARADLCGTLARAGGDGPAEAGAEEGAGVRREGVLEFAPTYKYELSSRRYVGVGDDQSQSHRGGGGRRTPAWCNRVLSYGKGLRLLGYRRSELYAAEVEVFSSRKLQRALTLTDAEVEAGQVVPDLDF